MKYFHGICDGEITGRRGTIPYWMPAEIVREIVNLRIEMKRSFEFTVAYSDAELYDGEKNLTGRIVCDFAVAVVSRKDVFSKKMGRTIAGGRLAKSKKSLYNVISRITEKYDPRIIRISPADFDRLAAEIHLDDEGVSELLDDLGVSRCWLKIGGCDVGMKV